MGLAAGYLLSWEWDRQDRTGQSNVRHGRKTSRVVNTS